MQSIYKSKSRSTCYCLIAWILIGIIVVVAAFFTYGNRSGKLCFSLENNDIYDLDNTVISNASVVDNNCKMDFVVYLEDGHFDVNYLRLYVKGVHNDKVSANIYGFGSDAEKALRILEAPVKDGINDFRLDYTALNWIRIEIDGTGEKVVKSAQFRESIDDISIKAAAPWLLLVALAYIILSAAALIIVKRFTLYSPAEKRKNVDQRHSKPETAQNQYRLFSGKNYPFARIILFFAIIAASFIVQMWGGEPAYRDHFHGYMAFQLLCVALVTICLYDPGHSIRRKHYDMLAAAACACLMIYTLLSDLMVDKPFRFSGLCTFIFLLLFAVVCNNRQHPETYIKNFEKAVQCFLILLVLTSIFFKEDIDDGRFSGPLTNPSIYALYLSGIWAVLLGSLEDHLVSKSKGSDFAITIIEMLMTAVLSLLAGSITPVLAMTAITGLFVFRRIAENKGHAFALYIMILLGVIGVVGIVLLSWYVKTSEVSHYSRIIEKLDSANMTSLFSGRNYYWKAYLRKMNLLGHGKKPFLWDHRILPHNAVIGMAYMYGVPCVVPYVLMMTMAVEKTWRFANTGLRYAAVPFYSVVSFIIMSMADNVEQPFVWLPWIACYLMMAPILLMSVEDIEALKKYNSNVQAIKPGRKHDIKGGRKRND